MNALDMIITAILCIATAAGVWKGLIKQVVSLGGVILGYIIAANYYERLARFITAGDPGIRRIAGFAAIFISVVLLFTIAGWLMESLLKGVRLNWINRTCGGALGLLKGALIVMIVTVVLLAFLPAGSRLLTESRLLPYAVIVSKTSRFLIPEHIKDRIHGKIEELIPSRPTDPAPGGEEGVE
ncbi:MAG: CvpA family protein [Nitrospirae bacterium]|nr:CvpA family protein [Nitrospirota bacterium]